MWFTSYTNLKNGYENFPYEFRLCHWSIVPWVHPSFGTDWEESTKGPRYIHVIGFRTIFGVACDFQKQFAIGGLLKAGASFLRGFYDLFSLKGSHN
jgi:hypothetical protein